MLCDLCLIKNQFLKINNSDKTGESRDGGSLLSLLIEIKNVLCPVGRFFCMSVLLSDVRY